LLQKTAQPAIVLFSPDSIMISDRIADLNLLTSNGTAVRSTMIARTQLAMGSASMMLSMVARAVCLVGTRESAGRPQRRFASRGSEREIGHARQFLEVNIRARPRRRGHREYAAARFRTRAKARSPDVVAPRQWAQGQKNRAVAHIRPADDLLDAVQ
jgi:hypothetical protein